MSSLNELIEKIENLKISPVSETIKKRIEEFENLGKENSNEIFKELCFCFLTANFNAEKSIKIQKEINDGFIFMEEEELNKKLIYLGHRFPNTRTKFIIEARKYKNNIKEILSSFENEFYMRDWVVNNIKGVGMKEASHFLRNIGYKNLAIIDFHIIDLLSEYRIIEKPKTSSLSKKRYIEIEDELKKIAEKTDLNLSQLDLYLWYKETGKILK